MGQVYERNPHELRGVAPLALKTRLHIRYPQGGSGHVTVRLGDRRTILPAHGKNKDLGKGLVAKIKKDLGLK
ncbi:MAG: type II toxin-antitoxin system HicA family toxin [Parvibaculaceae bacterium]